MLILQSFFGPKVITYLINLVKSNQRYVNHKPGFTKYNLVNLTIVRQMYVNVMYVNVNCKSVIGKLGEEVDSDSAYGH